MLHSSLWHVNALSIPFIFCITVKPANFVNNLIIFIKNIFFINLYFCYSLLIMDYFVYTFLDIFLNIFMKKSILYINHNLWCFVVNRIYIFIGEIHIKKYRDHLHFNVHKQRAQRVHNVASHDSILSVTKYYCIELTEYLKRHQIKFYIY